MRYELWDLYETEVIDCGELICTSDSMEEIRQAARLHHKETGGECKLFVKEWL